MYSLNMPVSQIRTKIRQEFERHRYVSQIKTVDVLLFNSHQEFQVREPSERSADSWRRSKGRDKLNGTLILEYRRHSTSGSSSHTYSSTSERKRTPRPGFPRTSFKDSLRYTFYPSTGTNHRRQR